MTEPPSVDTIVRDIEFELMLGLAPSGDLRGDVVELTQRMMDTLGELIAQYPEHWYMFRRMWTADAQQGASPSA